MASFADQENKKLSQGFTLLEMSLVIVIIGLIVGAVFSGQSLMRQSKINSIMTDAQMYTQAATGFLQKYAALPGDMGNATTYWGSAGGGSGDNYTTSCYGTGTAASPATCNGNSDGQIYNTNATYYNEAFLFWQHLADAKLISSTYTGVAGGAGTTDHVIGTNCPASRVDSAGFGISYVGIVNSTAFPTVGDITNKFDGPYGHALSFGAYSSNTLPNAAVLSIAEAQSVDSKFDDGSPNTGRVLAMKPAYLANCTVLNGSVYSYNTASATTVAGPQCSLILVTGF